MSVNYDDARSLNPFFARNTSPPWGQRLGAVLTVLGLGGTSPSLDVFADAVYDWETANALPNPNGILDQNAWAAMEPASRICVEQPPIPLSWLAPVADSPDDPINAVEIPMSGAIPLAAGLPSVVRIPVPGSGNLAIEFFPRNFKGKSTSTLFIQNMKGNKTLRLDYGFNKTTGTIDYHWNQKGTHAKFGIADHTTVGKAGQIVYKGAKYFRYAGRALVVLGAAIDVVHVVQSSNPRAPRQQRSRLGHWRQPVARVLDTSALPAEQPFSPAWEPPLVVWVDV